MRAFDGEFESGGGDRWSEADTRFYLTNRYDGPGNLSVDLGSLGTSEFGDGVIWYITKGPGQPGAGADGWGGRHVRQFETPLGRVVLAPDETLVTWDTCSAAAVPTIGEDGFTSVSSSVDAASQILELDFHRADDSFEKVVINANDLSCASNLNLAGYLGG